MDCIILFRHNGSGRVDFIANEDGAISVFPHQDDAIAMADKHPLLSIVDYQIVELDEL